MSVFLCNILFNQNILTMSRYNFLETIINKYASCWLAYRMELDTDKEFGKSFIGWLKEIKE